MEMAMWLDYKLSVI